MASYTPTQILPPTSTVNAVVYYTSPASTSGVIRTVIACANASASSPSFTFCIGTDGAATRVIAAFALTLNLPAIWNFWLLTAQNSANACGVSGSDNTANHVISSVGGYQYG
jgi:hypothetical protein